MKYLKQLCLIALFSFLGEVCRALIPYPIPASIYGMVLLFAALALKIVHVGQVRDAGAFLVSFLPVLFIAPTVNLLSCWEYIKNDLVVLILIIVVTTVTTFAVSGLVAQRISRKKGEKNHE